MKPIEERLLPVWNRWNGVIPVWAAERAGIRPDSLRRWAAGNPEVSHIRRGVYMWYPEDSPEEWEPDWDLAPLSQVMATAGPDAWLAGGTTLEYMGLGTVGGLTLDVGVPRRRRPLDGVTWWVSDERPTAVVAGFPSQDAHRALLRAMPYLDSDKAEEAMIDAWERGLLTASQLKETETAYERRFQWKAPIIR
ncbi:hypothetical protein [Bifidobacterium myosotis]|uniref:Transcriptional regulator n=1 Tax=Bifidobacterium myosotis TaxID=1630166 RepID=A0A5M9ZH33_9BIFI|nr:hypothetical protein [Bifidobacterium myosotis]KAA8826927.1 hypothetical protein EMO91_10370 [Bifidobacterium myosotis]